MTDMVTKRYSSRKMLIGVAVAALAYHLFPPFKNFENAYIAHRDALGNGYQAVCPGRVPNFYELVIVGKRNRTALDWVKLIWDGPPMSQKSVAFYVRPAEVSASDGDDSEPIKSHRDISFLVSGGAYDATASMTYNGSNFVITDFGVINGDSPEPFSARQVGQILPAIADAVHHCSVSVNPA
jgi:hypothetical protein